MRGKRANDAGCLLLLPPSLVPPVAAPPRGAEIPFWPPSERGAAASGPPETTVHKQWAAGPSYRSISIDWFEMGQDLTLLLPPVCAAASAVRRRQNERLLAACFLRER